jgi:hypothetical protein
MVVVCPSSVMLYRPWLLRFAPNNQIAVPLNEKVALAPVSTESVKVPPFE